MYFRKPAAIVLALVLIVAQSVSFAGKPELITLTWNDDPQSTQTITWRTDTATTGSFIEYSETGDAADFVATAIQAPVPYAQLATNAGKFNIHSGKITYLTPGTKYYFRVGDGKDWSAVSSFNTAPYSPKPFNFLVFGDSQSSDYGVWGKTVKNAYALYPKADFFSNVGDLVDKSDDYKQWSAWLRNAQGIINTIPCMPASGNHENYSINKKLIMPDYFRALLPLPQNGPNPIKGLAYSFDYSNAHFVVLDTQYGEEAAFVPNLLSIQKTWLDQDLAATDKTWKIVVMHRPLYNNTIAESHPNLRAAFGGLFDKYHVDVVFNGHDHAYARTYPLNDGKKTDTANGTVFINCGRSGTKKHSLGMSSMLWDAFFYNPTGQPNYLEVEIVNNLLTITALNQDGSLIESYKILKPDAKLSSSQIVK
ncbi:MAG: metallophosphoesterase family protein [Negativicutes bacterium]|jgi:hypothetical protein